MPIQRKLTEELKPAGDGRHVVRVYDIVDEDSQKYVNWGCAIISQKIENGAILDEWYVNIRPKEMDDLIRMLLKAKELGVNRALEVRRDAIEEKMGEIDDADCHGRGLS